MNEEQKKRAEELAEEYTSTDYFHFEYSTSGNTAKECQKAFIAGYEAGLSDLTAKLETAREALKKIVNPIECPACSMENSVDEVPCYCFEEWTTSAYIAAEALKEIANT